jgi:hypothetical protein
LIPKNNQKTKRIKTKKDKPIKEKIEKEPKIYDNYEEAKSKSFTNFIM